MPRHWWFFLSICLLTFSTGLQAKVIRIAQDPFPPWSIFHENSKSDGINIVTMKMIAEELDMAIEVVQCPFARCLKMMEMGTVDVMLGLFKTPERERYIHFVDPSYDKDSPKVFYLRMSDNDITNYAQLSDLHIGVVRDLRYFPKFDNDSHLRKWTVTQDDKLIQLLEGGRIDAFIGTESAIDYKLVRTNKRGLFKKASYQFPGTRSVYIGVSKHSEFMTHVDTLSAAVVRLAKTDEFNKIKTEWFKTVQLD